MAQMSLIPDLYHEVSSYLPNSDLYSLLLVDREISKIAQTYLHPTQEDFRKAVSSGNVAVVRSLLRCPTIDPSFDQNFALQVACSNGYTEIVEMLLQDNRVDASTEDNYPIFCACKNKHTDVVRLLLRDPRVDPTVNRNSIIDWAAYLQQMDIIELLLRDRRVNPHGNYKDMLYQAKMQNNDYLVDLLLGDLLIYSDDREARNVWLLIHSGYLLLDDLPYYPCT